MKILRSVGTGAAALLAVLALACPSPASAQVPQVLPDTVLPPPPPDVFTPPIGGTWNPITSIGQPSRWQVRVGAGYGRDGTVPEGEGVGGTVSLMAIRHLFSPVYGALALGGGIHAGQRGEEFDGGVQIVVESPALLIHAGVDRNFRSDRTDLLVGTSFPLMRGGLLRRGGEVRIDYLPGRNHAFQVGAAFPLREPLAGRTRPRQVDVELPRAPRNPGGPTPLAPELALAMVEVREAMTWLAALSNFFWLTENESLSYRATVRDWREVLTGFRYELDAREADVLDDSSYERKVEAYHLALDRVFGRAVGASDEEAARVGRPLADRARRVILDEVILPYNRAIGQYKQPDQTLGLGARARARWEGWADLNLADPAHARAATAVLEDWLQDVEELRTEISQLAGDSRMHWLPLALALRPEEHRTQSQIDGIVELALGRGFEGGNGVLDLNASQFQEEVIRTLLTTESYHLLWIHDIRGADALGRPDRKGFELVTRGYLPALIRAVREYDTTGRMPILMIMLDQHFYELNDGRRWMNLVEEPLTHGVRLPPRYREWSDEIRALQDSLQAAVEGSRRLQAEARAFGPRWIERVVKVHVNITNPADLSFRSRRLFGPPLGADNLLRDHRKIVIRDVAKDDPARGEVILAGVGIGEHYAGPTWDDRALILQGPAAAQAIPHARETLERHGLTGDRLPPPLRPAPHAPDHGLRVAALEARGATARVLQVHNRTGWGVKDATFVQMLLYDLAPPGTVLYVPDSVWTSFQWMAQLVGAALRGCHVYVVAPALENSPTAGYAAKSAMQELITRLLLIEEVFGDRIRRGGGDLRVGLFDREVALDDLPGLVSELEERFETHPFLQELFPFHQDTWAHLRSAARRVGDEASNEGEDGTSEGFGSGSVRELDRRPLLHRKTQWIVDREVLRAVAASPDLSVLAARELELMAQGAGSVPSARDLFARERIETTRSLLRIYGGLEGVGPDPVLYFGTGSMNKNIRSMALDAEALAVVGGPWALQSLLDLVIFTGGVTWVSSPEEAEALLPPFSTFQRRISRWLLRVL
jgi:phosphatidylserine/phosphatidylglycerophosphate/cardiolipin synthase-like enzyme